MFNEAGKCGVKREPPMAREWAIHRIGPKKEKTNVVAVGFPSMGSRARRARQHAKPVNRASEGVSR